MSKHFPKEVETAVLLASKRRCALCFGLDGDTTENEGQVAHVDRNPLNVKRENAAWLCTRHHSRYDSRSRQTKGHTPEELRAYESMLFEYLASPASWPDSRQHSTRGPGVSLETFDRRLPTYRVTIEFIRAMVNGGRHDLQVILKFAADTDEALFLFDDHLAEYLRVLYKQAIRLRTLSILIEPPERRTRDLIDEEMQLMLWFTEQFEEARRRFAPYLRLGAALANNQMQLTRSAKARRRRPRS